MNAADLYKSDRLKRVHRELAKKKRLSTLEIIQRAGVCAVSSIIAELRANGIGVKCEREGKVYYYSLEVE